MPTSEPKPTALQLLAEEYARDCAHDPVEWIYRAFNWGEGELKDYDGPDTWQLEILQDITNGLLTIQEAILEAVASGHGIGKSALVAWIILWALSTMEDTKGIVTANTETQLKTKTWAELAKWHRLFIGRDMFTFTKTAIYSSDPGHEQTWRVDMVAWSENKTEAFAGMHNKGKRILIVFDEASAIVNKIWEVTEGALTDEDTEIIWLAFGNPTRGSGRFFDCFNRLRHRWKNRQIDSRTARMTNKTQIQKWIDDLGVDSDFVKVRVLGQFPSASEHQFIPSASVFEASRRHLNESQFNFAAKIITLDNAWTGGDEIVIGLRQGLRFKILATFQKNDDDFKMAGYLARYEDEEKADAVLLDYGYGTGVYSAGKQLRRNWILIPFGSASPDMGYVNMRAFMWAQTKKWLQEGGAIPNDPILIADLVGPEAYVVQTGANAGKIYLESKKEMKGRGLASPNRGDALALSFAINVVPKEQQFWEKQQPEYQPIQRLEDLNPRLRKGQQQVTPYDPYKGL